MKRLALTALLPLALAPALAPVSAVGSAAYAAAPTCHGVRATIVGHDGDNLLGTTHRDVVVTGSARGFRGQGGNDLVCVTGSRDRVRIQTLNGNDAVYVLSRSAEVAFNGRLGSDTYVGNGQDDSVFVRLDGDDRVSTGKGHDFVETQQAPHPGRTSIDLGGGDDDLYLDSGGIHGRLVGGPGTNWLHLDHRSRSAWVIDDQHGRATADGQKRFRFRQFDHFDLDFLDAPAITFLGSDASEYVHHSFGEPDEASAAKGSYLMGGGDDTVYAGPGDDTITGGDGTDYADGGDGTDHCETEVAAHCES